MLKSFVYLLAAAWLAGAAPAAPAQTLSEVPGSVVYWRDSPWSRWFGPGRVYTGSPSIVVLPDGDYLVAFNLFGPGDFMPTGKGRRRKFGPVWATTTGRNANQPASNFANFLAQLSAN